MRKDDLPINAEARTSVRCRDTMWVPTGDDLGTQHEKKTVIKETSWQTISDKRVIWQTEHFIES